MKIFNRNVQSWLLAKEAASEEVDMALPGQCITRLEP